MISLKSFYQNSKIFLSPALFSLITTPFPLFFFFSFSIHNHRDERNITSISNQSPLVCLLKKLMGKTKKVMGLYYFKKKTLSLAELKKTRLFKIQVDIYMCVCGFTNICVCFYTALTATASVDVACNFSIRLICDISLSKTNHLCSPAPS